MAAIIGAVAAKTHNVSYNLQEEEAFVLEGPKSSYDCEVDFYGQLNCMNDNLEFEGQMYAFENEDKCMEYYGSGFAENDYGYYSFDCTFNDCEQQLECNFNIWGDTSDVYYSCTNGECVINCEYGYGD